MMARVSGMLLTLVASRLVQGFASRRPGMSATCAELPVQMATACRARSTRWPERGVRYLATRFSAKEAFSKAIGLGMRMPMTWRLCEIDKLPAGHANAGKPCIVLHGELRQWFESKGLQAHVSVTDETDYAASFCVVETQS